MDPASLALSIGALAETAARLVEYLHDVKDGGKQRIRLSAEISALWLVLENVQEQVEGWSNGRNTSSRRYVETLTQCEGALSQCSKILHNLEEKCRPRSGIRGIAQSLKWSLDKVEVTKYLESIHRFQTAINLAYAQTTLSVLEDVASTTAKTLAVIDNQESQALLDWLSPIDFFAQQSQMLSEWCRGTIKWYMDTTEYRIWLQAANPFLWTPGLPGMGKSVLASVVIDSLASSEAAESCIVMGIFFNSRAGPDDGDVLTNTFGSLLKQLVVKLGHVEQLKDEYREATTIKRPIPLTSVLQYIDLLIAKIHRPFLVVDGFDELPSNRLRLNFFTNLRSLKTFDRLSIMLVSRPDADLQHMLAPLNHICDICDVDDKPRLYHCEHHEDGGWDICESCYSLGKTKCPDSTHDPPVLLSSSMSRYFEAKSDDIERYVRDRLQKHELWERLSKGADNLLNDVVRYIVMASGSRFLIAKMYIDNVESFDTIKHFKNALTQPLRSLNDLFEQALRRLECQRPDRVQLAKETLKWVMLANQDMRATELAQAVQYSLDSGNFDTEDIMPPSKLVEMCSGTLSFFYNGDVGFAHLSTAEHFGPVINSWFPDGRDEIAMTCLSFLMENEFEKDWRETLDGGSRTLMGLYPFHRHAARYWATPLRDISCSETVLQKALRFLQSDSHRSLAGLSAPLRDNSTHSDIAQGMSSLQMVVAMWAVPLMPMLLVSCTQHDLDYTGQPGQTALHLAAGQGQILMVQMLLEAGASPDLTNDQGYTPLLTAVDYDHDDVVRLLLGYATRNAAVNLVSHLLNSALATTTPLILAAWQGSVLSLNAILDHPDLEINTVLDGLNALHRAIIHEHVRCVELLVQDKRCNPNQLTGIGFTPIQLAMSINDTRSLRLLAGCDRKIDGVLARDFVDQWGRTPLLHAALRDQGKNVRLLLQCGCSVSAEDSSGRNVMHYAAMSGGGLALRHLFELCSEANAEIGESVLASAIESMLNKGDGSGSTPLLLAMQKGNTRNAASLLNHGADLDIANVNGLSARDWQARSGDDEENTVAFWAKMIASEEKKPLIIS